VLRGLESLGEGDLRDFFGWCFWVGCEFVCFFGFLVFFCFFGFFGFFLPIFVEPVVDFSFCCEVVYEVLGAGWGYPVLLYFCCVEEVYELFLFSFFVFLLHSKLLSFNS
jgi:hypothetical protein